MMALRAENMQHKQQIEAGTKGRLKGHRFESDVTDELNGLDLESVDSIITLTAPNIYQGNPAAALVEHISNDKGRQIARLKAYWLGGLATAGAGAELKNEAGETITGSKSDVVMDVTYDDGETESIGVSVKSCGVAVCCSKHFSKSVLLINIHKNLLAQRHIVAPSPKYYVFGCLLLRGSVF